MGKTKGRYVAKPAGAPAKTPKALKTAAALYVTERRKLEKQRAALLQESEAFEQRQAEAAAAYAAATAAHEALLASINDARTLAEEEGHARTIGPAARGLSDAALAQAAETREKLRFRQGELLDETQSRMILLVYTHCVEAGFSPEAAVAETANTFGIGAQKIYNVRTAWFHEETLLTTSAKGEAWQGEKIDGGYDKDEVPDKTILEADDGVEAQIERGESWDLADLLDQSQENVEV